MSIKLTRKDEVDNCLVIDRVESMYSKLNKARHNESTTARSPYLDSLRGRGGWVGECDAE